MNISPHMKAAYLSRWFFRTSPVWDMWIFSKISDTAGFEPHVSFTSPSRVEVWNNWWYLMAWWFRFASNGILFNHESPRRGGTFVTKKVWHEENLKAIHGSYIPENSHIPGTNGWLIVGIRSFPFRTRSNCLGALAVIEVYHVSVNKSVLASNSW